MFRVVMSWSSSLVGIHFSLIETQVITYGNICRYVYIPWVTTHVLTSSVSQASLEATAEAKRDHHTDCPDLGF